MSLFPLRILDRTTIRLTVAIHGYRALLRNLPAGCRLPRATLEEAVESDGTCLALLRPAERTPGLCRRAVRENGAALRWVPRQLVDADLCRLAVLSNPLAIRAVPPRFLAPELVDLARRRGCPVPLLPFAGEQAEDELLRLARDCVRRAGTDARRRRALFDVLRGIEHFLGGEEDAQGEAGTLPGRSAGDGRAYCGGDVGQDGGGAPAAASSGKPWRRRAPVRLPKGSVRRRG